MGKHSMWWMIVGCTVPLMLIFLLPLFGVTGNYSILIFIVAMFAFHLMMPMQHGGHNKDSETSKINTHESHQH